MEKLKYYVDTFNANDEEVYKNSIDNDHVYEWLKEEIPLFECPDTEVERAYYFRWWTYRKHVKQTAEGYVITEFLPNVPWSGKYNVINAPNSHHLYEGRWLKNADAYLSNYAEFFLKESSAHSYSSWFIDSLYALSSVTGKFNYGDKFLDKLVAYYQKWEDEHGLDNGVFWSIDDRDAMEFSISGRDENLQPMKGVRPTLNSYMCADALAISKFASLYGDSEKAEKFMKKHVQLKDFINDNLWKNGFYRALHYKNDDYKDILTNYTGEDVKEEIGYIPWAFNIPQKGREDVFKLLLDKDCFYTPYGIASAQINHEKFLYEKDHECLWNGYVWPFATSQTLTALMNVIRNYGRVDFCDMYCELLIQYAKSHYRITENGTKVDWIDEVRHPLRDEWSSRELLKDWGWKAEKGGYERGKDYNHSTFCDLIISGIVGVNTTGDTLSVSPIIPKSWDWFKLENLNYRGKSYTVIYDKDGSKYGIGKGIVIKEK
ncbi:MAG: hypothetical protein E7353_04080 [Clostridiales bacterium]|nr:hypothetical protein [Clostridiales bacterium]